MHRIAAAHLKPGITPESLPDRSAETAGRQPDDVIRVRALVFWDPMSLPGTKFAKKLSAIDTDQITPATDCVSESLETLDEKWKAGSFRHLMPDFRARVHRGENFIVAGDRFAIGSSREMSRRASRGPRKPDRDVSSSATTWGTSSGATASIRPPCGAESSGRDAKDRDAFHSIRSPAA